MIQMIGREQNYYLNILNKFNITTVNYNVYKSKIILHYFINFIWAKKVYDIS
jgi:hypothetical protein